MSPQAPLRSLPLRRVLPVSVMLVFSLLLLGVVVHEYAQFSRAVDSAVISYTHTDMARLQRQVATALARGDLEGAEREIAILGVQREVDVAAALDEDGTILYATRFAWKGRRAAEVVQSFAPTMMRAVRENGQPTVEKTANGAHVVAYYPLELPAPAGALRSSRVGGLFLLKSLHGHYSEMRRIAIVEGSVILLAGLAAMGVLLFVLKRYVEDPLQQLAEASRLLAHGDVAAELSVRGRGEVAELARAFNDSARKICSTVTELRDREEKYRTIVDNTGLGILLIDAERRVIEANQVSRLWFPRLASIGGQCHDLVGFGEGTEECGFCQVEKTICDGEVRETVTRVDLGGEERHLRVMVSPVVGADGSIASCVEMIEDITERVETEQELLRVSRALRALSSANAAVVRAQDLAGMLQSICATLVDEENYRMAWIGRAEHDGTRAVTPLAHAGFEDGYLEQMRFSWSDDEYGRGPTGISIREARPYLLRDIFSAPSFAPWREAARVHGYASSVSIPLRVGEDVWGALAVYAAEADAFDTRELALLTELAETLAYGIEALQTRARLVSSEAALRQLNVELEQRIDARTHELQLANRELEAFTYSVSHDLRAPLRGIDGFSKVLVDSLADKLDPQSMHYLDRVRKASQRMGQLIDDLLGLSRINRQEIRLSHVNLSALARQILDDLAERDPERQVETVVEEGVGTLCDPRLTRVVLENLLGNAWKYTGRLELAKIEFGHELIDGEVVCLVRDNGAGFDMQYADKLFAPFQRLHRADEFEGTGIGLATVQRIIQRHHGRIWTVAAPGRGASFYFTLGQAVTVDTADNGEER